MGAGSSDEGRVVLVGGLEAESRMKSRLFFAMGNEGRRQFADSFPHTDISNIPFREFHTGCETLFKVEREYTVERIKLYNMVFMLENDTLSYFYARLSAQVALCDWPNDQEKEILKDLLIGRIREVDAMFNNNSSRQKLI